MIRIWELHCITNIGDIELFEAVLDKDLSDNTFETIEQFNDKQLVDGHYIYNIRRPYAVFIFDTENEIERMQETYFERSTSQFFRMDNSIRLYVAEVR